MKKANDPKKITQAQLLQAVSDANETGSCVKYGFILGAGASVTSGIPAGGYFAKGWYKKIKEDIGKDALKTWQDSIEGFDKDDLAASYTKLFAKRFEADYSLGYEELQRHMSKAKPSIGYSFLAQVLAETKNKFIITTNFDTMSEDALFDIKDAKPLVLGHEVLSTFVNAASPTRPTIIKIHRDFLFDPYNTDDKISQMDEQWQKALQPVLLENAMIVIGYGGNDESLMNYLKEIKDRKPIYWCCRNADKLSGKIKNLLGKKDFLVEIDSFDKFMLMLNDKLKFKALIDPEDIKESQIVKDAIARAEAYSKQLGELTKEDLDETEQDAIKKLLPGWLDYEMAVRNESDIERKNKLYQEGMKAHPKSHELMGNYALFLKNMCKNYDKAEEYYQKSLALDPEGAIKNGNYAIFLKNIRNDYNKAEKHYQKALALDPDPAIGNSNYAQLLLITERKAEADKYMENAFAKIDTKTETDLALELWFYRLAHYPEFFEEAKKELDRLLAEGHKSLDWHLDDNIKQAKKDGFKDIQLLKDYAKKITQE